MKNKSNKDTSIIIDGICVTDCIECTNYELLIKCEYYGNECNKHPNCYYKQLQRAKAEIEQLKSDIERVDRTVYRCRRCCY